MVSADHDGVGIFLLPSVPFRGTHNTYSAEFEEFPDDFSDSVRKFLCGLDNYEQLCHYRTSGR